MRTFFASTEEGALDSYVSFLNIELFLVNYGGFSYIDLENMALPDFFYFYKELEKRKKEEDREMKKIRSK